MYRETRFERGQLVRHRVQNFRGVIYEVHETGKPDDDWGQPSQTLEEQECPWYKVLIHGQKGSTFVSELDLVEDEGGEQVANPKVKALFESFSNGRYQPRIL